MDNTFDAIVIGGGVIGLAAAFHLCDKGLKTVVLEKEYPGSGSTNRCIGGIRQQFSTEASIKLMQESIRQFKEMEEIFGFSVEFYQGGYLFLAFQPEHMEAFKKSFNIQKKLGLDVRILSADECRDIVPQLNTEGLIGGVYSPEDGQAYPFKVLEGYIREIEKKGSALLTYTEVTDIILENDSVKGVRLKSGKTLFSDIVLNAAGPWAAEIGKMAGVDLPIFPEKHEAFITDRLERMFDPMLVDYRPDGCYFNQRVNGQVIGCYTPKPNIPGTAIDTSLEFLIEMSRRTVRLIPELAKARIIRQWAGSYSNTPDLSPIIDRADVKGYYVAAGMSGHGFMFAPAIGKYISDIIIDNRYPFDWDEFKLKRNFSRKELLK